MVLALTAIGMSACAAPAWRGPRPPDEIAVSGRGEVSVSPDTAILRLGAEARRPTLEEATRDVAARMSAVLERVKALGVADKDIRTSRYAVEPVPPPPPRVPEAADPARIAGYRVSNVVQLRLRDVTAAARVVDAAVAAGANVVLGVTFTLDDFRGAEAAARARAVAAAQATAAQLARAAGVALGRVLSITETAPISPLTERAAIGRATVAAGPIEAGELQVSVTVDVRYAIER